MDTESAKALVRQVVDDWNRGDLDALDEHLDPAYVNRDPNNLEVTDLPSYKRWAAAARAAFPDLRVTIEDLIAEGDKVVARVTIRATHTGEFMGIPPTGKHIETDVIDILRFADGKVIEHWAQPDRLGMYQQLGLLPAGPPTTG